MEIKPITRENAADLALPNEPFSMPGRFLPSLEQGRWHYEIQWHDVPETMTFPAEDYDYDALTAEGAAFAAYEDGRCLGLIVLRPAFYKYMHVYDLKVRAAFRGRGMGRALLEAAKAEAARLGCRGLYLQAQASNVNACLFYLKNGFEIGGYDNHVYNGTSREGDADIIFYTI